MQARAHTGPAQHRQTREHCTQSAEPQRNGMTLSLPLGARVLAPARRYGLTALLPDYCLLCCCAVGGLGRMSREHLAVAVALHIPVLVVITKVRPSSPHALPADPHSLARPAHDPSTSLVPSP